MVSKRDTMFFTKKVTNSERDLVKELYDLANDENAQRVCAPMFERMCQITDYAPFQTEFRIVYENPDNGAIGIVTPAAKWMGMAMAGDIIDPIELLVMENHKLSGYVRPCPALTEEQAIEYLLIKDVLLKFPGLFDSTANHRQFAIVTADQIRANRDYRQAWNLSQELA